MIACILLSVVVAAALILGLLVITAGERLTTKVRGMAVLQFSAVVFLLGFEYILYPLGAGENAGTVHPVPVAYILAIAPMLAAYILFGAKIAERLKRYHGTDVESEIMQRDDHTPRG